MLESKIYPKPEIQQFLSTSYVGVLLQSESQEGQQLMRQYRMRGIPALFVMDAQGRVIGKMSGAPSDANSFMQMVTGLSQGQRF
jgi:thioredoxin-related protein